MAPLMVAFAPAAKIEAKVTSATPIMSAAAVTAVRPGWRTEFSRASRPVMPVARSIGRPMTFASGRTSRGESSATPMKVSAAPPPMNEIAALSDFRLPKSPTHMSPTPIASSSPAPMAIRRPRPRCIGTTPSRSASTGGTRVARIAGAMLATRRHHRAHEDRDDHRARLDDDALARQVGAERLEQRAQAAPPSRCPAGSRRRRRRSPA